jgi:hypothetical protein
MESLEPVTGPYPEPDASSQNLSNLFAWNLF